MDDHIRNRTWSAAATAKQTCGCDLTTTYRDGHEAVWCRTCGAAAKVEPEFGETLVCRKARSAQA